MAVILGKVTERQLCRIRDMGYEQRDCPYVNSKDANKVLTQAGDPERPGEGFFAIRLAMEVDDLLELILDSPVPFVLSQENDRSEPGDFSNAKSQKHYDKDEVCYDSQ